MLDNNLIKTIVSIASELEPNVDYLGILKDKRLKGFSRESIDYNIEKAINELYYLNGSVSSTKDRKTIEVESVSVLGHELISDSTT